MCRFSSVGRLSGLDWTKNQTGLNFICHEVWITSTLSAGNAVGVPASSFLLWPFISLNTINCGSYHPLCIRHHHTAKQVDMTWPRFGVKSTPEMFFLKNGMLILILQLCHLGGAGELCTRHGPGPQKLKQLTYLQSLCSFSVNFAWKMQRL